MKKLFTLVLTMIFGVALFAQNVELSERLMNQYKTNHLKATNKNATHHNRLWKTPLLKEVRANWNQLTVEAKNFFKGDVERHEFSGEEIIHETEHFAFHYTISGNETENVSTVDEDNNGTPDYIDKVVEKFENMYTLYHQTTGLSVPPSDGLKGGSDLYDVYISDDAAGEGTYGYMAPEDSIGDNPNTPDIEEIEAYNSFMVIRNNYDAFGDEEKSLSVTTAHEYMHSIQNGYSFSMETWFMEIWATWSEEFAYPGYDDNFQYLMDTFGKTDVALNLEDGEDSEHDGHWYGSWIFAQYLTEHTGNEIVKNLYEHCIQNYALDALDMELSNNWQSSLSKIFLEYSLANIIRTSNQAFAPYTYARAEDYNAYIEGNGGFAFENAATPINFTGDLITWDSKIDGNDRLMRLSTDYFYVTAQNAFNISFNSSSENIGLILLKAKPDLIDFVLCDNGESVLIDDYKNWQFFIPIVIRFDKDVKDTESVDYSFEISADVTSIENNKSLSSEIEVFPNPSSDFVSVKLTEMPTDAKIEIRELTGKKIIEQNISGISNNIDVRNLKNGMYLVQIKQNNTVTKTQKIIISR